MDAAVIVFPGSNCDRDVARALQKATGQAPHMVWHGEAELPEVDLIVLPGGFSYGDYLRGGAIAAHSPIMQSVVARAEAGVSILGICNGFQILTECGLLPGTLMRNTGLKFLCKPVALRVENAQTRFSDHYAAGDVVSMPIAHNEGNYQADAATLEELTENGRIIFRYAEGAPNGATDDIAGIINAAGNVLGMMPHPERVVEPEQGGIDGRGLFDSLVQTLS